MNYLAFDLGAESGRAILGSLSDGKLQLTELNRFQNGCLNIRGRYHWDIFRLFEELKKSLATCALSKKQKIASIAIDTWGVDFGLLAKDGTLLSMPYAYRDHQTDGIIEQFAKEVMPKKKLYQLTGIQLIQFNSIFQLYALRRNKSPLLGIATDLLFTPDLLNYLFTGIKKSEFTIASTSQLLNPFTSDWDPSLFDGIGIAKDITHSIVYPGTILGQIDGQVCSQSGLSSIPLVVVPSHDTASAIAAIPADGANWAYLSSGTWSLMGIEVDQPIVNEGSFSMDFTNEGGAEGKYLFMKNLCGLWLLQECKRIWDDTNHYSYDQLTKMASEVQNLNIFVNSDAPEFYNPANMPMAIAEYCAKTGQRVPGSHSEYIRCIFDSLVFKYLQVFGQIKKLSSKQIDKLHIIGGGSKNALLCQLTANALGIPVIAGPSEATAIGNILYQAKAMGEVSSLAEIRKISANSTETIIYQPVGHEHWKKLYKDYLEITKQL
jgi:rhamnulokinase